MSDLLDPSLHTLAPLSLTPQQQKDLRLIGAGQAASPQAASPPGKGDGASFTPHVQAIQDSSVSLAKVA